MNVAVRTPAAAAARRSGGGPGVLTRLVRRFWLGSGGSQASILESQAKLFEGLVETPMRQRTDVLNSVDTLMDDTDAEQVANAKAGSTVVLAHGFGSGLGFFFPNIDAIARAPHVSRVLAVDWLGMGGSDRPACHAAPRMPLIKTCSKFNPEEAADFFVDSLEEWRKSVGLEKFTLVGHSLGGYLSARYVLKYPGRVESLVLASPVGLPQPLFQDLAKTSGGELPFGIRAMLQAWKLNITPQQFVRLMGPQGPGMVLKTLDRRFGGRWEPKQLQLVGDYFWRITVAPASGEYAMNSLLTPVIGEATSVYARDPLHTMLPNMQVDRLRVLFGDTDWLHTKEAMAVVQELKVSGRFPNLEIEVLEKAGHHLYYDNHLAFNEAVINSVPHKKKIKIDL